MQDHQQTTGDEKEDLRGQRQHRKHRQTAREDAKNKKPQNQNVQEIQDTMRRRNLRIIGVEEDKEYQL